MFRFYHPELEYGLMVMEECLTLTPDLVLATRMTSFDMDGNYERSADMREAELAQIAAMTAWLETEATPQQKALSALCTLLQSSHQYHEMKKVIHNTIMDAVRLSNGYRTHLEVLCPRKPSRLRVNLADFRDSFTDFNRIGPEEIQMAAGLGNAGEALSRLRRAHSRMRRFIPMCPPDELCAWIAENRQSPQESAHRQEQIDAGREVRLAKVFSTSSLSRRQLRKARQVVLRGTKLYESMFGRKPIASFMKGEEIVVSGTRYDYHARMSPSVDIHQQALNPRHHHTPYILSVHNKGGEYLGRCCIYFEDTPIVDSLIGMSLFVRDEESEKEFLCKANFFDTSAAYLQDKPLQQMKLAYRQRLVTEEFPELLAQNPEIAGEVYPPGIDGLTARLARLEPPAEWMQMEDAASERLSLLIEENIHSIIGLPRGLYESMLSVDMHLGMLMDAPKETLQRIAGHFAGLEAPDVRPALTAP